MENTIPGSVNIEQWSCVNHGAHPTTNISKKYAIFVGRYQPYHHGHTSLIMQKIRQGVPALILVRDIAPDAKNPFTTEQTVAMIRKFHASYNHDVMVMIIPDIESVNYGRGVGYEVNEFAPPEDIGFISATKIRQSLKEKNDDWRAFVDDSIQGDVERYLLESDVTL